MSKKFGQRENLTPYCTRTRKILNPERIQDLPDSGSQKYGFGIRDPEKTYPGFRSATLLLTKPKGAGCQLGASSMVLVHFLILAVLFAAYCFHSEKFPESVAEQSTRDLANTSS
jgi:hypothetical protein